MSSFMDFRRLNLERRFDKSVSFKTLENAYYDLCDRLNYEYPSLLERTGSEKQVASLIEAHTRMKLYFGYWIGKHVIDVFIPGIGDGGSLSSNQISGLAIEVDGPVHNEEFKMRKDQNKLSVLSDFKIALYSIQNGDLSSPQFMQLLKELKYLRKIEFRTKKRLFRNIYIYTLLEHLENQQVTEVLGFASKEFIQTLRRSI